VYEAGEGFVEVVGGDGGVVFGVVGVEVEPGEDCFVEELAGVVGGGVVEVARSVEEIECGGEDSAPGFEAVGGLFELLGDAEFAVAEVAESGFEFGLWPVGVAE
jgi:hypothetical protein